MMQKTTLNIKSGRGRIYHLLLILLGLLFLSGLVYNIFWRRPLSWLGVIFSLAGTLYLLATQPRRFVDALYYRLEIGNGIIREHGIAKGQTVSFSKVHSVDRTLAAGDLALLSITTGHGMHTHPEVIISGLDMAGLPFTFRPSVVLPINKLLFALKTLYPEVIISNDFAQDTDIWNHRRLFGKVQKSQLALTIFLLVTPLALLLAFAFLLLI